MNPGFILFYFFHVMTLISESIWASLPVTGRNCSDPYVKKIQLWHFRYYLLAANVIGLLKLEPQESRNITLYHKSWHLACPQRVLLKSMIKPIENHE